MNPKILMPPFSQMETESEAWQLWLAGLRSFPLRTSLSQNRLLLAIAQQQHLGKLHTWQKNL